MNSRSALKTDSAQITLESLQEQVVTRQRCPRVVRYFQKVARDKRRMFLRVLEDIREHLGAC
ncbi:MAG: hypothetical protein ACRD3O_20970 [Terriglobia bacterium]